MNIKRSKLLNKLQNAVGAYTVVYVKKDGTPRILHGVNGIEHNLKGGVSLVEQDNNDLFVTFDIDKIAYRTINLATTIRIRVGGRNYEVVD